MSVDPGVDRYRDRYQLGNRRTIRLATDTGFTQLEQNTTWWILAYTLPSTYEPEGRVFESPRAHHKNPTER